MSEHISSASHFRLLDIGAGAGFLGDLLRSEHPSAEYCFVEPIPTLELALEDRFGRDHNYGLRDAWPDIGYVTLLDVLEHQEDDLVFLEQMLSKLDVGTKIILTVPALMSLWSSWDDDLGHYRRYNLRELHRLLDQLPLDVVEVTYLFPELLPAAYFRSFWRKLRRSSAMTSEFPSLPRLVNDALYAVGRVSIEGRHWIPAGTSLLAVAVRT